MEEALGPLGYLGRDGHDLCPMDGHWPLEVHQRDRRQSVSKPLPHRLRRTVMTDITVVGNRFTTFNQRNRNMHAVVACSAFYHVLEDVHLWSGRWHETLVVTNKKTYGGASGVRGVRASSSTQQSRASSSSRTTYRSGGGEAKPTSLSSGNSSIDQGRSVFSRVGWHTVGERAAPGQRRRLTGWDVTPCSWSA